MHAKILVLNLVIGNLVNLFKRTHFFKAVYLGSRSLYI